MYSWTSRIHGTIAIFISMMYHMNYKDVPLKWTISKDFVQTVIFQERCQLSGEYVFLHVSDLICMVNVAKHTIH